MDGYLNSKQYIDFSVTPYTLPRVLLALFNEGIKDINVTQEDNDLHIRLDADYVKEIIYKLKKENE